MRSLRTSRRASVAIPTFGNWLSCRESRRIAERRQRTIAFFGNVVSSMTARILAADESIGLNSSSRFQSAPRPRRISDEMVQLVIVAGATARIGCTLLRSPGPISRNIKRTHPRRALFPNDQEWLKPRVSSFPTHVSHGGSKANII